MSTAEITMPPAVSVRSDAPGAHTEAEPHAGATLVQGAMALPVGLAAIGLCWLRRRRAEVHEAPVEVTGCGCRRPW